MTTSHEYAGMALALINGVPLSQWPSHQQEQYGRPGAADIVREMIATSRIEALEEMASHCGPSEWVRGEFRLIRWWAGERLRKRETEAPRCEHPAGKIAIEDGIRVCQQCGWEVAR